MPWLQRGYDAHGTFSPPGNGPAWSDVALELPLDGQPQRHIVVIDGYAYVLVEKGGLGRSLYSDRLNGPSELVRVDLNDGSSTTLVEWDSPVDTITSDGERLFIIVDEIGVVAVTLEGEDLWEYYWPKRYPGDEMRPNWSGCWGGMNVAGDGLTVGCELGVFQEDELPGDTGMAPWQGEAFGMVARLDTETGEELWNWTSEAASEAEHLLQRDIPQIQAGSNYAFLRVLPLGISVTQDTVVFLTHEFGLGPMRSTVVALENETGAFRWSDPSEPILPSDIHPEYYDPENPLTIPASVELLISRPVIHDNLVLVKHDGQFWALNLGTGERMWPRDISSQDTRPEIIPYADMAVVDDLLFVASAQTLYRYSIGNDNSAPGWQSTLNGASGETFEEGPLVVGDTIFMGTLSPGNGLAATYAFDKETGQMLWRLEWPGGDLGDFAYSDGLLVFPDRTRGSLVVIGGSEASLEPELDVSDIYPGVGNEVRVDLSDSGAGVYGLPTRFKADWGDGTVTDWQGDPVMTHAYDQEDASTARFFVGNDANQTSSATQTFDVGGSPPRVPNALESAFAPEQQDLTFGVLGIVVALTGGVIALWHRHSKRGRMQRELAAIEQAYEDTKDEPAHCEAMLVERKAHCRGLLLDGKLEEAQFAVLENRIDELSRTVRLSALDDRFDFLPHGLVKALKDMLSDGRISAWERNHVTRALDEDKILTKRQKQKVQGLVDQWFERDAGVAEVDP